MCSDRILKTAALKNKEKIGFKIRLQFVRGCAELEGKWIRISDPYVSFLIHNSVVCTYLGYGTVCHFLLFQVDHGVLSDLLGGILREAPVVALFPNVLAHPVDTIPPLPVGVLQGLGQFVFGNRMWGSGRRRGRFFGHGQKPCRLGAW